MQRRVGLFVALLSLVAMACLLARPAASSARTVTARCTPQKSRSTSRQGSCSRHHSHARTPAKHRHHSAKHKRAKRTVTVQAPATPAQTPALCEDASTPVLGSEGFQCADGSEPICTNGAEAIPTGAGSQPVCPATPGPMIEWSEANCEDGSTPTPVAGGFACEDGSQPTCEAGYQQLVSSDGSTLSCVAYGNGSPPPDQESDESESAAAASGS